ncbi:hypothetical protein CEXT_430961 [Caerostris extrusa]|uniref:Uncharacterized protein n=1 Tax=Caerostris extrusa TaxID=172846 RepID=A0AAV4WWT7_CAEEX|nr:hypothetical protein CEXT_430961 [Caerostris extrusa]
MMHAGDIFAWFVPPLPGLPKREAYFRSIMVPLLFTRVNYRLAVGRKMADFAQSRLPHKTMMQAGDTFAWFVSLLPRLPAKGKFTSRYIMVPLLLPESTLSWLSGGR